MLVFGCYGLLPPGAAGEVVEYFHIDALGSIRAVTDKDLQVLERHDYEPFGEECTTGDCASNPKAAAGQPLKFTGKERDTETGFDYFGARYYGPDLGRFTGIDPAMTIKENILDPQRWNRYVYARDNPLRFIDPDGKEFKDWIQNGDIGRQVQNGLVNGVINFGPKALNTISWMSVELHGCRECSIFYVPTRQGNTPVEILTETAFDIGINLLPFMKGGGGGGGSPAFGLASAPGARTTLNMTPVIQLSRRLTHAEMANIHARTGVEHALVYLTGKGRAGGGGTYYLIRGTAGNVPIPLGPNLRWISHTHPAMLNGGRVPLRASGADFGVLGALQSAGSPQRSSVVVPELGAGAPFRFGR